MKWPTTFPTLIGGMTARAQVFGDYAALEEATAKRMSAYDGAPRLEILHKVPIEALNAHELEILRNDCEIAALAWGAHLTDSGQNHADAWAEKCREVTLEIDRRFRAPT